MKRDEFLLKVQRICFDIEKYEVWFNPDVFHMFHAIAARQLFDGPQFVLSPIVSHGFLRKINFELIVI